MKHQPVTLTDDEITFKSCTTVVFRWVRKTIKLAEGTPILMKSLADEVAQAWKDSAKS
jgi:hypothetical protein